MPVVINHSAIRSTITNMVSQECGSRVIRTPIERGAAIPMQPDTHGWASLMLCPYFVGTPWLVVASRYSYSNSRAQRLIDQQIRGRSESTNDQIWWDFWPVERLENGLKLFRFLLKNKFPSDGEVVLEGDPFKPHTRTESTLKRVDERAVLISELYNKHAHDHGTSPGSIVIEGMFTQFINGPRIGVYGERFNSPTIQSTSAFRSGCDNLIQWVGSSWEDEYSSPIGRTIRIHAANELRAQ